MKTARKYLEKYRGTYRGHVEIQVNPLHRYRLFLANKRFWSIPRLTMGVITLKTLEYLVSLLGYLSTITRIMITRIIAEAVSRLSLYITLPCITLRGRLNCVIAGILNVLLTVLSLRSLRIMRLYDALCRRLAVKTGISFHGYTVRAVDCEGMTVFHPLYEMG